MLKQIDSQVNFGKEAVAVAYRRPKQIPHYSEHVDSERAQDAQAPLSL